MTCLHSRLSNYISDSIRRHEIETHHDRKSMKLIAVYKAPFTNRNKDAKERKDRRCHQQRKYRMVGLEHSVVLSDKRLT